MVRLHFSRVIFQALDLYVYATRSDKWKTCLAWCGSVSSQRSSLANLNMQMSLRITTKPVQPLLTPCTWKKRVVFRRFSAIDRILSLTGNLEALSTNFVCFQLSFSEGRFSLWLGFSGFEAAVKLLFDRPIIFESCRKCRLKVFSYPFTPMERFLSELILK